MKTDTTQSRHSGLLWRSIFFPLAFIYMDHKGRESHTKSVDR